MRILWEICGIMVFFCLRGVCVGRLFGSREGES